MTLKLLPSVTLIQSNRNNLTITLLYIKIFENKKVLLNKTSSSN